MPDSHTFVKSNLSFAKLVATPTDRTWSQAYNAGNLFSCLSLTIEEKDEQVSLPTIGKEVLSTLEAEYFGLTDKSVAAIKEAITTSIEKVPEGITIDLILANFKDATLSVFIVGDGKVVMKRAERTGILLEKKNVADREIHAASGYLQSADIIVLQTGQFAKGTSDTTVASALELTLPTDIVESLSPQMHEQDNGAQAAIVIAHHSTVKPSPAVAVEETEQATEETQQEENLHEEPTLASLYEPEGEDEEDAEEDAKPRKSLRELLPFSLPQLPSNITHVTHKQKLFLSIAIILLILLCSSIYLTMKKQADEKQAALFQEIYTEAKQSYEEGKGLESLNPSLSRDSFVKAESKLKEGDGKIPENSKEGKQLADLKTQIENELQNTSSAKTAQTKESTAPENSLLAVEKANSNGLGFGQDNTNVYVIDSKAIISVSKSSGSKKESVKNDSSWDSPVAVVPYQSNIYVLDPKNGVLKFVSGNKSSYFSGTKPDLSQASGMAIDGSVWIVTKDGRVLKYTKGIADSISLSGLDAPLKSPSRIITTIDMNSVYILDPGSSRIVQIDKKGAFQKAFTTPVITKASDFDVNEKEKKILILSEGKVWELAL